MSLVTMTSLRRSLDSSYSLKLCPRCEEGALTATTMPHELTVAGSVVRLPNVQAEECRACGYKALSGRETRLFDVLFEPRFGSIAELVAAIRAAGYRGMFLRESAEESALFFGSRDYVAKLASDLREIYLDNEAGHVLHGLDHRPEEQIPLDLAGRKFTLRLPKIGEGENGVVFDFAERPDAVLKLAKPRPYSREHVRQECELTEFFARHGVPVPAIVEWDRFGSFCVKQRLAGESLAVLYTGLGPPASSRHRRVRAAVEAFAAGLLELFAAHPEAKTSISPNNIFVVEEGETCRCLLVDAGPAPFHDYSSFDFDEYWQTTVPRKIAQYRSVGFI